jgi:hypothetical protein
MKRSGQNSFVLAIAATLLVWAVSASAQTTPPAALPSLTLTMVDMEQGITLVAGGDTYLTDASTQFHDVRDFNRSDAWEVEGTTVKIQVRDTAEAGEFPTADHVWILRSPNQY